MAEQNSMRLFPKNIRIDSQSRFSADTVETNPDAWKDSHSKKNNTNSKKSSIKRGTGVSGTDVLEKEPERLLNSGVTRKLLLKTKDDFIDFKSFVKRVKEQFNSDSSLRNLIENVSSDSAFENLYNLPEIQAWGRKNALVPFLSKNLSIGKERAEKVYGLLTEQSQKKLLRVQQSGQSFNFKEPSKAPLKRTGIGRQPFTKEQVNFLAVNKTMSPTKLTKAFNDSFGERRSVDTIESRLKLLRKL